MISIPVEPPITEYLHMKAAKLKIPLNGTFELTPLCNMDCRMCYVKKTKEQQQAEGRLRSAKEWLDIAEEMKKEGMVYLLLTGGEPFTHPEFKEIMQGLHKMGFVISINTNGTLINEEVIEWLKEVPPVRVNMTIYGGSDETYECLCRNPKGFSQLQRAVQLLQEAGISVKLNCSVTPHNIMDLEKMFDFANKNRLLIQATSYMFPPIRKDMNHVGKNDRLTPTEAAYAAAKIEMLMNGKEKFCNRMKEKDFNLIIPECYEECLEKEGEGIRCRAGKCSFWVTWNGELLPCGMMINRSVGNVFEQNFKSAWTQLVEQTAEIRLPAMCKGCNLKEKCRACAAMVLSETGTYTEVPQYKCEMTKAYPYAYKRVLDEIDGGENEKE